MGGRSTNLHKAVEVYDKMLLPTPSDNSNVASATDQAVSDFESEADATSSLSSLNEELEEYEMDDSLYLAPYFIDLEDFISNLGNLTSNEDPVSSVGRIAPILYKLISSQEVSNGDIVVVENIADGCAKDLGPSKYYAISILNTLDIPFTNISCAEEGEPRERVVVNKSLETEYVKFNLYDISGRLYMQLKSDNDIRALTVPFGIYLLQSIDKTGNSIVKKVIIP